MRRQWVLGFLLTAGVGSASVEVHLMQAALAESKSARPPAASPELVGVPSSQTPMDKRGHTLDDWLPLPSGHVFVMVNDRPVFEEEIRNTCLLEQREVVQRVADEKEREAKKAAIFKAACEKLIDCEVVLQDAQAKLSGIKQGKRFLDKLREAAEQDFETNCLRKLREQANLRTEDEIAAWLKTYGMSLELYRRQCERNFMKMDYLRNLIWPEIDRIGPDEAKEYYQAHPEEFRVSDSVDWQDICIAFNKHASPAAARRFAESIMMRARAGEDFAQLAQGFDDGSAKYRPQAAGEGNYREDIKPEEVVPVLFALHEGEIGPPVELAGCIHIVRVAKRVRGGVLPFDEDVRKKIKNKLRSEAAEDKMKRIIQDLRSKAIIEYVSDHMD